MMPWDVKDVTGLRGMLNLSQNVSRPFKANMSFGYVAHAERYALGLSPLIKAAPAASAVP